MRMIRISLAITILLAAASMQAQSLGDLKRVYDSAKSKSRQATVKATASARTESAPAESEELMLWVQRHYASSDWESSLHSELLINDKSVNVFTADTWEPIEKYLKQGWNTITLVTTPQEPADHHNGLLFRIGPMRTEDRGRRRVMSPVVWHFRNDTDWKLTNGRYTHALGPNIKEVTLNFKVYWAGMNDEVREIDAGDVVLMGDTHYDDINGEGAWNSPITTTVFVNGHPFNTFTLAPRQLVITPYLKPGKNEIKIVSSRIDNAVRDNDLEFAIAGPATWNATEQKYMMKPMLKFNGMQGWSRSSTSGMLSNKSKPSSDSVERILPLVLKDDGE